MKLTPRELALVEMALREFAIKYPECDALATAFARAERCTTFDFKRRWPIDAVPANTEEGKR